MYIVKNAAITQKECLIILPQAHNTVQAFIGERSEPSSELNMRFFYIYIYIYIYVCVCVCVCVLHCTYRNVRASNFACPLSRLPTMQLVYVDFRECCIGMW